MANFGNNIGLGCRYLHDIVEGVKPVIVNMQANIEEVKCLEKDINILKMDIKEKCELLAEETERVILLESQVS